MRTGVPQWLSTCLNAAAVQMGSSEAAGHSPALAMYQDSEMARPANSCGHSADFQAHPAKGVLGAMPVPFPKIYRVVLWACPGITV